MLVTRDDFEFYDSRASVSHQIPQIWWRQNDDDSKDEFRCTFPLVSMPSDGRIKIRYYLFIIVFFKLCFQLFFRK